MVRSGSQTDTHDPIAAYFKAQAPELRAICDKLQVEIDKGIGNATSKTWHGSPVWFIAENSVAGCSVRQKRIDLMFWSGQLFEERSSPLSAARTAPLAKEGSHHRIRLCGDV
jgi:hypothetical protein